MPSEIPFFEALQKYVNATDIIKIYYGSASKKGAYPYGVISDPSPTDLEYGNQTFFDINVWSKDPIGADYEEKIDELIKLLNGHIFTDVKAVLHFEGKRPVSDPEFELIKKKITFSVRIF